MITEDERWRQQFSDDRSGDRDGYRPYNRENRESSRNSNGEGRPKRPRIHHTTYEPARPQNYGQHRDGGYQSARREGGYQSNRREGGYQGPRREGSYSSNYREGGKMYWNLIVQEESEA